MIRGARVGVIPRRSIWTRLTVVPPTRKILTGAIALAKVQKGEIAELQFRKWLKQSLSRPDNLKLFDRPGGRWTHNCR